MNPASLTVSTEGPLPARTAEAPAIAVMRIVTDWKAFIVAVRRDTGVIIE